MTETTENKRNRLVFATNNQHKLKEIREILSGKFEVLGLKDIGFFDDIEESGTTLNENASIKSRTIHNKFNIDVFADDTGLEVKILDNKPGVYSARYAGEDGDSEANIKKLLIELEGKENRTARFRTVISLIINNKEYLFEGIVYGSISRSKHGSEGFGYDPVFFPKGYNKSFAQMTSEEKNKISHRAKAMAKLIDFLNKGNY
ncbi:MAG: non-canonical purine NTP pyrophosphatase [Marinilabiliales bacterium]|nr:MAG: non-canonical purine NTP pyrophosphatase [Marinilabiliales bacterium]